MNESLKIECSHENEKKCSVINDIMNENLKIESHIECELLK